MKILLPVMLCVALCMCAYGQITYLPMGKIDKTFGTGGSKLAPNGVAASFFGDSVLLPDGKMIFMNTFRDPREPRYPYRIEVSRTLADGEWDPSFGDQGTALFSFGNSDYGATLTVLPDGKLIVVGSTEFADSFDGKLLVFRITQNGQLDTTSVQTAAI